MHEDAGAVRDRLRIQILDAIQDGTYPDPESSAEDSPLDLSAPGRKKLCEYCGEKGTYKCKRCNLTYYCSEAHQAAHHAKHQYVCDQLDGVKLTRQMKDLRWVGPPIYDDDDDDDEDEEYDDEDEYDDEEYENEDDDYWPYDDEEDVHKGSEQLNVLPIKTEAKTGPSVSMKGLDTSASSLNTSSSAIKLVPGSSASGPKTHSNVPKEFIKLVPVTSAFGPKTPSMSQR